MPIIEGFDEDSILSVNHLGIVAGAFDALGIAKIIDRAIPKTRHHNLDHSQVVKAMSSMDLDLLNAGSISFPISTRI